MVYMKNKREDFGGIYAIVNFRDRKFYVGSSRTVMLRMDSHRARLRRGKHHSKKLQTAWDEIGEDSFEFIVLERNVDLNDLQAREIFWIDVLRGMEGYNSAPPCFRADTRTYRLKSLSIGDRNFSIGQPVWDGKATREVSEIKIHDRMNIISLDGRSYFGSQIDRLVPMDCD